MSNSLLLSFPEASVAEANKYVSSLSDVLREIDPAITLTRNRERSDTQDFGATLVLILGTASATAVAQGIATWLARYNTKLTISDGQVVASGLESGDMARIAEAVSRRG